MGWLRKAVSFLKNAQVKPEKLTFSELQDWLQRQMQELVEQHNLLSTVNEHTKILEDKRWALEARLDIWQKRTRLHPHANEVIILFRETRQLLDKLHFPNQPAIGDVLAVNQELESKLQVLIKKLEGSVFLDEYGFVLEEGDDLSVNPLLSALLDLDAARKNLDHQISGSSYHVIQVIGSKAGLLQRLSEHLQHFNQDLHNKKSRLTAAQRKKEEKEKSLQLLQSDTKNHDLGELTRKKKELEKKQEELEMEVLSFFSRIKPLLQRYKEIEPSNGLLFSYLKDPLSSFFQDEGLFIIDLLEKIAELLRQGKFALNHEDLITSLSALEGIYCQRLRSIKEEYAKTEKELGEVAEQMQRNLFVVKVDDAAYRLEHYSRQVKRMEEETNMLVGKISKLQELMIREQQEIQKLVKNSLGREIVLA